jgi:hypothetical protein
LFAQIDFQSKTVGHSSGFRQGACLKDSISNGKYVLKLMIQPSNDIQALKNCVTSALKNALLGARPQAFRPKGMFEIVHPAQKMTGVC